MSFCKIIGFTKRIYHFYKIIGFTKRIYHFYKIIGFTKQQPQPQPRPRSRYTRYSTVPHHPPAPMNTSCVDLTSEAWSSLMMSAWWLSNRIRGLSCSECWNFAMSSICHFSIPGSQAANKRLTFGMFGFLATIMEFSKIPWADCYLRQGAPPAW